MEFVIIFFLILSIHFLFYIYNFEFFSYIGSPLKFCKLKTPQNLALLLLVHVFSAGSGSQALAVFLLHHPASVVAFRHYAPCLLVARWHLPVPPAQYLQFRKEEEKEQNVLLENFFFFNFRKKSLSNYQALPISHWSKL